MTPAIVVHAGGGTVEPARQPIARASVRAAAAAGHAVLARGGSALDAVVIAVRLLEDDPETNAGTGSVLTRDGTVETDAAVMTGHDGRIGAVGAVPELGCAVDLARAVLERGEHVLLVGPAAWRFAAEVGIQPAPPGTLVTERQRVRLAQHLATRGREDGGGTVGAVARDARGHFAAATSTGGMVGKRAGRVGDSPIPGAGTWADADCAVSATGDGEGILRVTLARLVALGLTDDLATAARAALSALRSKTGATAGLIAIGRESRVALRLTETMPVAWVDDRGLADSLGDPA